VKLPLLNGLLGFAHDIYVHSEEFKPATQFAALDNRHHATEASRPVLLKITSRLSGKRNEEQLLVTRAITISAISSGWASTQDIWR
jgi:hypothetical protein